MPTVRELGALAEAVYDNPPTMTDGWVVRHFHRASGAWSGFQAATFQRGSEIVIAFRGTAQAMDAAADLKLGTGMNSTYFASGDEYAEPYRGSPNVFLCGHSLGGAITQIVANRGGFKFATFNAPGVAVVASRNIGTASLTMSAIRVTGMVASAVRHPIQAGQDVAAAFNVARGLNVCLAHDAVSQIGLHYGDIDEPADGTRDRHREPRPGHESRGRPPRRVLLTRPGPPAAFGLPPRRSPVRHPSCRPAHPRRARPEPRVHSHPRATRPLMRRGDPP